MATSGAPTLLWIHWRVEPEAVGGINAGRNAFQTIVKHDGHLDPDLPVTAGAVHDQCSAPRLGNELDPGRAGRAWLSGTLSSRLPSVKEKRVRVRGVRGP